MSEFAVYENTSYKYFLNMEGETISYFLNKIKGTIFDCSFIIVDQLFYTGMAENRLLKFNVINGHPDIKSVEYFNESKEISIFNFSIVNSFKNLCKFYLNEIDYGNLTNSCNRKIKRTINFSIEDI